MSPIELHQERSATERLLERSWEARERRASQRELIVDAAAGALFGAVAIALLMLGGGVAGLSSSTVFLLIAVYALVGRIEFPVGAGYVVPTQLILVPMLLILPPSAVPPAVGAGMLLGNAVDWAFGREAPRRVLSAVADSWHAIGPAAVLVLAGSPTIGFAQLPLLAGALAAGCLVDLTSALLRTRLAGVLPDLRLQIRVIGLVWAVDACLAPLGVLAGLATREHASAILLVLPLVFLLWLLARDRVQRIDKAHHRLKLVEQERARLRSAVRRLGDAFAAKLELESLLEIFLNGSVEALDAAAGKLELAGGSKAVGLSVGAAELDAVGTGALTSGWAMAPINVGPSVMWCLNVPMRIPASPRQITGSLWLARAGRAFEEDEILLVSELAGKAELAAAEIIAHEAIREQAMTDPLTGLGNRRRLTADLGRAFSADANVGPSVLLLFDLDGFKGYNDTFGHLAGDELLARLGGRLQQAVAGAGSAYRLGGDEFCAHLILDDADSETLIARAAAALSETGPDFSIRASFGVVLLPQEADDPSRALRLADERMYADKRGRSDTARSQAGEVLTRTMRAKRCELDEHSSHGAMLTANVADLGGGSRCECRV
jgi:diguanylate cyclase (GGDEF)-like protein